MITLPYRATFLSNFRSQEEGMAAMVQWIGYVGTLKEAMWTFFRHRGLEVID